MNNIFLNFSWRNIIYSLKGYTDVSLEHGATSLDNLMNYNFFRKLYPRPSVKELVRALSFTNTTSFLIARHPYERLVSGYVDKFLYPEENPEKSRLFAPISQHILFKYRKLPNEKYIIGKTIPTFTEFSRYVVDEYRAGNHLNGHWEPVYRFCTPCQVNITHIIKFETFDRDTKMILYTANLSQYSPKAGKIKENASPRNTTSSVEMYLNELPLDLLNDLREVYKIDFEMLGYPVR